MTVHLITTSDMKGGRQTELMRLLRSITANASSTPETIHLVLLLQNCTPADFKRLSGIVPESCSLLSIPDRCSLSVARNQALAAIEAEGGWQSHDIIGFPDDDCWYPDRFIERLVRAFRACPAQQVLFCRSSLWPDEGNFATDDTSPASVPQIVRLSSSNNVFYKGSILSAVGLFDPELGLGTPVGGSEDTDYMIRALLYAGEAFFIDRKLVGHAEPSQASAARYFRSSLIVLTRYAHRRPRIALELLRKLCVGLVFVGRGTLSFRFVGASVLLAMKWKSIGGTCRFPAKATSATSAT